MTVHNPSNDGKPGATLFGVWAVLPPSTGIIYITIIYLHRSVYLIQWDQSMTIPSLDSITRQEITDQFKPVAIQSQMQVEGFILEVCGSASLRYSIEWWFLNYWRSHFFKREYQGNRFWPTSFCPNTLCSSNEGATDQRDGPVWFQIILKQ